MHKLLFILLTSVFVFAEMDGNRYFDKQYNFEITVPDSSWTYDLSRRGKQVVFLRNDGVTEVSVEVQPLQGNQKTGQDVAKDQNIAYDGWQFTAGRELDWHELHGATNGFSAMYNKVMLKRISNNTKLVVQEGYFVKNRYAYIVTLTTDTEKWPENKNNLLRAWNSFKIN